MTRDQFEQLLRSTGCGEDVIYFGLSAFEMGSEYEREMCAQKAEQRWLDKAVCSPESMFEMLKKQIADDIRSRGNS